eukprot:CAMPEP_0202900660 /NCGR_PEP_ID=MMETSP1392-20130828/11967_1 /ASSEMBLY_ACC=CAM_ASM_000868 /TAXON_ID=225041 /ORGANISM="Chlamydomonas chlamydogama, Strain SAG 11-48b" /LENGTH=143 /DNA_ID=CAMNT_0049587097 /DNA_START=123 /DNA_END=554 /DNA_ORIENTATION=-
MNQLRRYHFLPDPFLTTKGHFHDSPGVIESPDNELRGTAPHKRSTHAKLYSGSWFQMSKRLEPKSRSATDSTVNLGTGFGSQSTASQTYRGNGDFIVELPHSTITYRNLKMVPYNKLTWKSEYTDKYQKKQPYKGYSILSSRR